MTKRNWASLIKDQFCGGRYEITCLVHYRSSRASGSKSLVRYLSAATPSLRLLVILKLSRSHSVSVTNSSVSNWMSPMSVRRKRRSGLRQPGSGRSMCW